MITESFDLSFRTLTPDNKLNFIGAVVRYFDVFTNEFNDETKNTYIRDYNNRIGQYPVTQYNEDYECDFDIEHPIMDEAIKVCQPDNRTFLY